MSQAKPLHDQAAEYAGIMVALGLVLGHDIMNSKRQMQTYAGSLFRGVICYYLLTEFKLSSKKAAPLVNCSEDGGTVRYWKHKVEDFISIKDAETLELLELLKPNT